MLRPTTVMAMSSSFNRTKAMAMVMGSWEHGMLRALSPTSVVIRRDFAMDGGQGGSSRGKRVGRKKFQPPTDADIDAVTMSVPDTTVGVEKMFRLDKRLPSGVNATLLKDPNFMSGSQNSVALRDLFDAGVHFGHKHSMRDCQIEPYLYGVREDMSIFNLETTLTALKRALNVIREVAYNQGIILFVGARPKLDRMVEATARSCGEYFVNEHWRRGTLTNRHQTLRQDVLPDLVIMLTMPTLIPLIREASFTNVPTVGIVDSDMNPNYVTYAVPGNDDSYRAMQLYCQLFARAINEGKLKKINNVPLS